VIVIEATTLLEVCLMRSQSRSDLLYEVPKAQRSAQHVTVIDVSVT
jgi:hypothetical protein